MYRTLLFGMLTTLLLSFTYAVVLPSTARVQNVVISNPDDVNLVEVSRCFQPATVRTRIQALSDGVATITFNLPAGLAYVPGTVTMGPQSGPSNGTLIVTETDDDTGMPVFTVTSSAGGGIMTGDVFIIETGIEANCDARATTTVIDVSVEVATPGGPELTEGETGVSVLTADLSVEAPFATSLIRLDTTDVTFSITNGGFGALDSLTLVVFTDNPVPTTALQLSAGGGTVIIPGVTSGQMTTYGISGDAIATAGDGDRFFEIDEVLTLTRRIAALDCGTVVGRVQINDFYRVNFGCPGQCQMPQPEARSRVNVEGLPSNVLSTSRVVQPSNFCTPFIREGTLRNNNDASRPNREFTNIQLRLALADRSSRLYNVASIDVADVFIIAPDGTRTSLPFSGGTSDTGIGIVELSNLTTDPDGPGVGLEDLDGDGRFDDLPAGQTFTYQIEYEYEYPECNTANDRTGQDYVNMAWDDACGFRRLFDQPASVTAFQFNDIYRPGPVTPPVSILRESDPEGTIRICAENGIIFNNSFFACDNPQINLIVGMPPGLDAVPQADYTVRNDTIFASFATLQEQQCFVFTVRLDLTELNNPPPNFNVPLDYTITESCTDGCPAIQRTCSTLDVAASSQPGEGSCDFAPCLGQPIITGGTVRRINLGYSTQGGGGVAPVRIMDPSMVPPINLIRGTSCDTLAFTGNSSLCTSGSSGPVDNYYIQISNIPFAEANGEFTLDHATSGTFTLKRADGSMPLVDEPIPAPVTNTLANGRQYLTYEFAALAPGGIIDLGDTIFFNIQNRLNPEAFDLISPVLQRIPALAINTFTLPPGQTDPIPPSSDTSFACVDQALNFQVHGTPLTTIRGRQRPTAGCRQGDVTVLGLAIRPSGGVDDYYEDEIRPHYNLDSITIRFGRTFDVRPPFQEGSLEATTTSPASTSSATINLLNPSLNPADPSELPGRQLEGFPNYTYRFYLPAGESRLGLAEFSGVGTEVYSYQLTLPVIEMCGNNVNPEIQFHGSRFDADVLDDEPGCIYEEPITTPNLQIVTVNTRFSQNTSGDQLADERQECFNFLLNIRRTGAAASYITYQTSVIAGSADLSTLTVQNIQADTMVETVLQTDGSVRGRITENTTVPINLLLCLTPGECASRTTLQTDVTFSCNGYPAALNDGIEPVFESPRCNFARIFANLVPGDAAVQFALIDQPGAVDLCEPLLYSVRANSSQISSIYNPTVTGEVPQGFILDSVRIEYPLGSGDTVNVTPGVAVNNGGREIVVPLGLHPAVNDSLPGTDAANSTVFTMGEDRQANVFYHFSTDCNAPIGATTSYTIEANRICGERVRGSGNTLVTAPLRVNGATIDYLPALEMPIPERMEINCDNFTFSTDLNFVDEAGDGRNSNIRAAFDSIILFIPAETSYVSGSYTCTGSPLCPTIGSITNEPNGDTRIGLGYPRDTTLMEAEVLAYSISYDVVGLGADANCGDDLRFVIQSVSSVTDVPCATAPGGICMGSLVVIADEADVFVPLQRVDVANLTTTVTRQAMDEYTYAGSFDITGTDLPAGQDLVLDVFCFENGVPAATPFDQLTYSGPLAEGTAINFSEMFTNACTDSIFLQIATMSDAGTPRCLCEERTLAQRIPIPPMATRLAECQCFDVEYDQPFEDPYEFIDTIQVMSFPEEVWTVTAARGLEQIDTFENVPLTVGTRLTPDGTGKFILAFAHTANIGYEVTISNGTVNFDFDNTCFQPNYVVEPLGGEGLCDLDQEVPLEGMAFFREEPLPGGSFNYQLEQTDGTVLEMNATTINGSDYAMGDTVVVRVRYTPPASPADVDNDFCPYESLFEIEVDRSYCDCELEIEDVTAECTFDEATTTSSFTLDVTAIANPDKDGETVRLLVDSVEVATTTIMNTGVIMFEDVAITNEPAFGVAINIEQVDNPACNATRFIDLLPCAGPCSESPGRIGGVVFFDDDLDGMRDGSEAGVGMTRIRVYDETDNLFCETRSTATGEWSCTGATPGDSYRVEFDNPNQPELTESLTGPDNLSSVQFITVPEGGTQSVCGIDFGVTDPTQFCQDDPLVVVPCYYVGLQNNNRPVLIGFYYDEPGGERPEKFDLLLDSDIGTTWGVAYQNDEQVIYTAAVVRNYMDYGPAGFDAIYVADFSDPMGDAGADPSSTLRTNTINLENFAGVDLGVDPRTNGVLTPNGGGTFTDAAWQGVGKAGIGDIDISPNGDTLYVINLNEAAPSLIILDVTDPDAPTLIDNVAIPDPGCSDGDFAPWALKYNEGNVFVGVTCTGETSQQDSDLSATVYRYDGGTTFTTVASASLDYARGAATFRSDDSFADANWQPWTDTWGPEQLPLRNRDLVSQPMPIVQDLEFGEDGSLYVSIGDRFSFMSAFGQREWGATSGPVYTPVAGGDLLRFCGDGAGNYTVEGIGGCPQPITDLSSIQVPAIPTIMEYFDDNYVNEFNSRAGHAESMLGGLGKIPGRSELMTVAFDPILNRGPVNTSGVRFYSENGNATKGLVIVPADAPANNAKGGSLGDLEPLCDPAPIEIGNYAWYDFDIDGTQDAGEPPVVGLSMTLYRINDDGSSSLLATTQTNNIGQYYFLGDGMDDATWTGEGAGAMIRSTVQYAIVAGLQNDFNLSDSTFLVNGGRFRLTVPNMGARVDSDLSDSDFTVQTIDIPATGGRPAAKSAVDQMVAAFQPSLAEIQGTNTTFDIGLAPPRCELDFEDLTVNCMDGTDFTVTFDLDYDYANATAAGEMLNVTVDGVDVAGSPFTLTSTAGTLEDLTYSTDTPEFGVAVRAFFENDRDCEISRVIDLVACTEPCMDGGDEVGGNVFNDSGNDGTNGTGDAGQGNVRVRVYDCDENLVCDVYTNEDGDWSCDGLTSGEQYRVEYSNELLPNLEESFAGPDNASSVQFVTAGTCGAPYALFDRSEFCEGENVRLAISCYETGRLVGGDNAAGPAFVSFPLGATGDKTGITMDAELQEIGATWGTAYVKETGQVYSGTLAKRHIGIANTFGTLYQLDYDEVNNPTFVGSIELQGVVPRNRLARPLDFGTICRDATCANAVGATGRTADYTLPVDPTDLSIDIDAFDKVGKVGFGDVDYDPRTGLLWMVNLNERTLVSMDPTAADPRTTVNVYEFNDAFGVPSCPGGEPRPWGLEFDNGFGYVGMVCDAAATQSLDDLESFVMQFDPTDPDAGYTTLTRIPLQEIGRVDNQFDNTYQEADLVPWKDNLQEYPQEFLDILEGRANFNGVATIRMGQPIISDLDFTPAGDLIVSVLDRTALQIGYIQLVPETNSQRLVSVQSYGDLFWMCPRGDGGYRKEGLGDCTPANLGSPFYNGDDYFDLQVGDSNQDGAIGSHIVVPGSNQVAYAVFDPFPPGADPNLPFNSNPYVNTQGIHYNSLTTGARENWYRVVTRDETREGLGKGQGLGDLIAICEVEQRIQIGNRVWVDENEDGIQNACEPPLAGVTVKLFSKAPPTAPAAAPVLLATNTTDASGNYYFAGDGLDDATWEDVAEDTLVPGNQYFVAFCGDNGYDAVADTLNVGGRRYCITTPNATATGSQQADAVDSDITEQTVGLFGDLPAYCITAAEMDTTNHTFDAGFIFKPNYDLALRKTLSDGQAAGFRPGDNVSFDIDVLNQGDTVAYNIVVGDSLPDGLTFVSATPAAMTALGEMPMFTDNFAGTGTFIIDSLNARDTFTLTLTVSIDPIATSQTQRPFINFAEIQAFDDDRDPNNEAPEDVDSTPDGNFSNDSGGTPRTNADNALDGDGSGMVDDNDPLTDEDDQDAEFVPIFDLALTKVLADATIDPATVANGDPILFNINVFNQGTDSVQNVVVRDSIPCGYSFDENAGANNGVWSTTDPANPGATPNPQVIYATIDGPLGPAGGDQLMVTLTFENALCGDPATELTNRAEIQSFEALDGSNPPDFDSTPDGIFGNDAGGQVNSGSDDVIRGNGTGMFGNTDPDTDEDDEDPSDLNVFDLAIRKMVDEDFLDGPYMFGDRVKFDIDVINQGTLPATEIVVTDLLPSGLSFDAADPDNQAIGWVDDPQGASLTLNPAPPLEGGDSIITSIYLTVEPPAAGDAQPYVNFAEITSAAYEDPNDPTVSVNVTGDGDSPFSLGVGNDTGGGVGTDDDDQTRDNRPGEDIDSQDPAFIVVLQQVALGDTTFIDVNGNGTQDGDDLPLANVTVTVFNVATGQPVTMDVFGNAYNPTRRTDMNGRYLFDSLTSSNYYVQFDITTADQFELYDFTTPNVGDDARDSDVNPADSRANVANSDNTGVIPAGDTLLTLDAGVACAVAVEVANEATICATQTINLGAGSGASITPASLGGFWTTDGTGTFLDVNGDEVAAPFTFGQAVTYVPSREDGRRGSVTFTLTTNDPGDLMPASVCEPASESVTITVLNVDCGDFFWDGNEDD